MAVLSVVGLIGLTACDRGVQRPTGGTEVTRRATVAHVGLPASDALGMALKGGALRYARDVPSVQVTVSEPADDGLAARLDALAHALTQPLDAVCLYLEPADVEADSAMLRERLAALGNRGTPIITIGAEFECDRIVGHVGVNLPDAATLAGEKLSELASPRRTYLLVHNDRRGARERDAAQRLRSATESQAGLVCLKEADGDADGPSPCGVISGLASLFPNCGLLVTLDPGPWLRGTLEWERGLRERSPGVRFVTLSAHPRLWRRLGGAGEPGFAAGLVGPLDGEIAYQAVRMAVELVAGERRGSAVRWVPVELVTSSNLGEFAARYGAAAGDVDFSAYLPRAATSQPATPP